MAGVGSIGAARGGFSLAEAVIALTIASGLVLLVGALFLVQNDFYSHVLLRSQVQENARALTEVIATEIRSVGGGGVVFADSSRLVIDAPMVTAMVCGGIASDVAVHIPGGTASITTADVGGFGYLDPSGTWSYYNLTWSQMLGAGGSPEQVCYNNGADTVGISSEFLRLERIDNETGVSVSNLFGSALVIIRQTELKFAASVLIPGDRALYRGIFGGTLTEFVTGLSDDAHFEYWTGAAWQMSVTGAGLASITQIRLVAQSQGLGESSQQLTYDFGWTVDIPLANTM